MAEVRRACLVAVLLLAGCAGFGAMRMGPAERMIPPQPDRCGLSALPDLTGQEMSRLADFRLQGPLRVIWPVQEVTAEIQSNRINAEVDVEARILRLFCG
mgnify:CR=1 FL=1